MRQQKSAFLTADERAWIDNTIIDTKHCLKSVAALVEPVRVDMQIKSGRVGFLDILADTLDTLWIADLKDEYRDGVEALLEIDFTKISQGEINVFGTTIHYLGGFIAAFDLSEDRPLLDKAIEVAEMLYVAFDTPNRMPIMRRNPKDAAASKPQLAGEGVLVAEIGSLSLEFTRLAQLTHSDKWYDCIERIMQVFDRRQGSSNTPGMWPLVINARTQDFASGDHFTLAAMADSLYEYLPKMYALLGDSSMYAKMYEDAMNTAIEETVLRPMVSDNADILLSGNARSERRGESQLQPQGQRLVCYAGGMMALARRLLKNETHVELGRKLTDGCIWTYEATPLGIMPEVFDMLPCKLSLECPWDEAKWKASVLEKAGQDSGADASDVIKREWLPPSFTSISDRRYILRPEAIESVFLLYRITGDPILQEKSWQIFTNISEYTETEFTNAALRDVTDPSAPEDDSMESFWTAETLKYFFFNLQRAGFDQSG